MAAYFRIQRQLSYIFAFSYYSWGSWGFPRGSEVKASASNEGDLGSIPGEGNGNPFQYSCLQNPMNGGAW